MKQIITKFDDETGDFDVVTPIPFTLNDGIEYADVMGADIPKYEDTETYNVFDLIRENQELRKQTEEHNLATENIIYWKGKNESKMKINRLRAENKDLKDKLRTTKEVAVEHLKKEIELKQQLKVKKDQNKKLKSLICMSIKLNKKIINVRKDGYSYEQIKPYLLKQYDVLKKYKEIVGGKDDKDIK